MRYMNDRLRLIGALVGALAAGSAIAADLPSAKAPPAPLAAPAPAFSWQGFYVGAYAGALLGEGTFTYLRDTPIRGAGFLGGGTLGYNWQWTPTIVLGLEADFGYRGSQNAETVGWNTPSATETGVFGTFRGRVGYAFTRNWLIYGTAGLAYGSDFVPTAFTSQLPLTLGQLYTGTTVRAGWTAGAGVEYAWSDKISVKGEYLYTELADSGVAYSTNFGAVPLNVKSAGHIVRGGVNYHFATPAAPPAPILTK